MGEPRAERELELALPYWLGLVLNALSPYDGCTLFWRAGPEPFGWGLNDLRTAPNRPL
jgi:hypothetical protein